jgi:glycogen operon protein
MTEAAAAANVQKLLPGKPYPLGATLDAGGINFAVFSSSARRIYLCLFDATGTHELARLRLPRVTHHVFHGYLQGAKAGTVYGLRAVGRYLPKQGLRFNAHKLLLDPYARMTVGPMDSTALMRADRVQHPMDPESLVRDRRDSASDAPKARVDLDRFDWSGEQRPNTPLTKSVIYEAHVRGISMLRHDLEAGVRGTFAALADPHFIGHLKRLGVTAIELLPVHAVLHDYFLRAAGLCNFWGYNNVNYFVVNPQYLASDSLNEVRQAIKDFHAAGLEVILDVVYNHTGEGNERGPTISFRGLDDATYYLHEPDAPERYINDTGCGNTLAVSRPKVMQMVLDSLRYWVSDMHVDGSTGCGNSLDLEHPRVLQLVMDSLRYWVEEMHVDGFRFDLAPTLGREPYDYDIGAGFFDALMQDPVLSQVKLIAEPWDVGWGGYRVGQFPPGFSEWNDKFRDCVRRFCSSTTGAAPRQVLILSQRTTASP